MKYIRVITLASLFLLEVVVGADAGIKYVNMRNVTSERFAAFVDKHKSDGAIRSMEQDKLAALRSSLDAIIGRTSERGPGKGQVHAGIRSEHALMWGISGGGYVIPSIKKEVDAGAVIDVYKLVDYCARQHGYKGDSLTL